MYICLYVCMVCLLTTLKNLKNIADSMARVTIPVQSKSSES